VLAGFRSYWPDLKITVAGFGRRDKNAFLSAVVFESA
jgi:hypothetical protein